MTEFWWSAEPQERYWLEITGRDDIGTNLNAPQQGEGNAPPHWSYSLIWKVHPGDVVLHWHTPERAIVGFSRVTGQPWEDEVIWAPRGTSARKVHTKPHAQPGWYLGLEAFLPISKPVTGEMLRGAADTLWAIRDRLKELHGDPIHFPFYPYGKSEIRAQQAYLTKFPRQVLSLFPALIEAAELLSRATSLPRSETFTPELGTIYRPADEDYSAGQRDPFAVDPAIVERGLRGHASTQNALASYLRKVGIEPRSPGAGDPNFDLAWEANGAAYVAEVKSLTPANQEKQLRLGLGQILRFRHVFEQQTGMPTMGVLALECRTTDESWVNLCSSLGIILVWKGHFNTLSQ